MSIAIALVAREGFAWTSPASNPPLGSGVLKVSGGNVGIGTSTPSYTLEVNGTISGASVLNPTYAP